MSLKKKKIVSCVTQRLLRILLWSLEFTFLSKVIKTRIYHSNKPSRHITKRDYGIFWGFIVVFF